MESNQNQMRQQMPVSDRLYFQEKIKQQKKKEEEKSTIKFFKIKLNPKMKTKNLLCFGP
jgi:hypothetical protein